MSKNNSQLTHISRLISFSKEIVQKIQSYSNTYAGVATIGLFSEITILYVFTIRRVLDGHLHTD